MFTVWSPDVSESSTETHWFFSTHQRFRWHLPLWPQPLHSLQTGTVRFILICCRNTFQFWSWTCCWQKIEPFALSCSVAISSLQSSIETLNNFSSLQSSAVILALCDVQWNMDDVIVGWMLLMFISYWRACRMIEGQCVLFCRKCRRSSTCRKISWRIFWKMLNWTGCDWRVGHFWRASGKRICVKMRTIGTAAPLLCASTHVRSTTDARILHPCVFAMQPLHVLWMPAACSVHVCCPCSVHV